MAGKVTHWDYTSDDGSIYKIREDDSNAVAAGNTPFTVGTPLPSGYHPRYVLAAHPTTGRERRIVITDPINAIYKATGQTTITLTDFTSTPSAQVVYTVNSRIGEKRYNR